MRILMLAAMEVLILPVALLLMVELLLLAVLLLPAVLLLLAVILALDLPLGTVKSRVRLALQKLQIQFER